MNLTGIPMGAAEAASRGLVSKVVILSRIQKATPSIEKTISSLSHIFAGFPA